MEPTPEQTAAVNQLRAAGLELTRTERAWARAIDTTRSAVATALAAGIPARDIKPLVGSIPGSSGEHLRKIIRNEVAKSEIK